MKYIDYVAISRGAYHWYVDYLHQIKPFVKIITDIEDRSFPKYQISGNSVDMIDDGISPEDRDVARSAKRCIETIRQHFEDKFYYDQRRNNQIVRHTYPGTTGRHIPDDPGNGPGR